MNRVLLQLETISNSQNALSEETAEAECTDMPPISDDEDRQG
jgi:hypothetical protein